VTAENFKNNLILRNLDLSGNFLDLIDTKLFAYESLTIKLSLLYVLDFSSFNFSPFDDKIVKRHFFRSTLPKFDFYKSVVIVSMNFSNESSQQCDFTFKMFRDHEYLIYQMRNDQELESFISSCDHYFD
jgi:hypothetical protein